jgi:hypothetical protein
MAAMETVIHQWWLKRIFAVLGLVTTGFTLGTKPSTAQVTCETRLKRLHCVRGTVIDEVGAAVPNASIVILKNGIRVDSVTTDANGTFSFDEVGDGTYELDAKAAGYNPFRFPIVVEKPNKKCSQSLEILLRVGQQLETCPNSIRLRK